MKSIKGFFLYGVIVVLLLAVIAPWTWPGEKQAARRVRQFIQAVNANTPEEVYVLLTPELQQMLSRAEFSRNFAKERSYPYLTPLYIYLDEVRLSRDKRSGEAVMTVAARLPGEKMRVKLRYWRGQYYVEAFREVADGTYLNKFKTLN